MPELTCPIGNQTRKMPTMIFIEVVAPLRPLTRIGEFIRLQCI